VLGRSPGAGQPQQPATNQLQSLSAPDSLPPAAVQCRDAALDCTRRESGLTRNYCRSPRALSPSLNRRAGSGTWPLVPYVPRHRSPTRSTESRESAPANDTVFQPNSRRAIMLGCASRQLVSRPLFSGRPGNLSWLSRHLSPPIVRPSENAPQRADQLPWSTQLKAPGL
jgi:hypothetical protein